MSMTEILWTLDPEPTVSSGCKVTYLRLTLQSICEMFCKALRTLMDEFMVVAEHTAELVIQMYQAVPHPRLIDLSKQVGMNHMSLLQKCVTLFSIKDTFGDHLHCCLLEGEEEWGQKDQLCFNIGFPAGTQCCLNIVSTLFPSVQR